MMRMVNIYAAGAHMDSMTAIRGMWICEGKGPNDDDIALVDLMKALMTVSVFCYGTTLHCYNS